jgi:micrococcal nuclease
VSPSVTGLTPQGPIITGTVVRVVDGDTVRFLADGQREDIAVRLIGMNTPETVAPGRPVECFGPEASQFAKDRLEGARVLLELDPSQGETDRYDRTLGYIWTVTDSGDPRELFNVASIRGGYAEERQYGKPFAWQSEFIEAERQAQNERAGLWGAC